MAGKIRLEDWPGAIRQKKVFVGSLFQGTIEYVDYQWRPSGGIRTDAKPNAILAAKHMLDKKGIAYHDQD